MEGKEIKHVITKIDKKKLKRIQNLEHSKLLLALKLEGEVKVSQVDLLYDRYHKLAVETLFTVFIRPVKVIDF